MGAQLGASVLGKAMQSAPSSATSANRGEAIFNNSGWTVNFGEGSTVSPNIDAGTSQLPGVAGNLSTTTLAIGAIALIVLWKMSRKTRSA